MNKEITLNSMFERYMSVKANLRNTTRTRYSYTWGRYIKSSIGVTEIADLKYSDILYFYYDLMSENNIKINTLNNINTVLHPTFEMAVRDDIITKNPAKGVMGEVKRNLGKDARTRHALSYSEQCAFMNALLGNDEFNEWKTLFIVMIGTGMRVGEVLGLCWNDVDFDEKTIRVSRNIIYKKQSKDKLVRAVSEPKSSAGFRIIPMLPEVLEAMRYEYYMQERYGRSSYELDGVRDFIFVNRRGHLHHPQSLNKVIERVRNQHNSKPVEDTVYLPHFTCHSLRHTFCSRLVEQEVNVKVVQEIMGHADISTTLNIYTEISNEKKQQCIDELSGKVKLF